MTQTPTLYFCFCLLCLCVSLSLSLFCVHCWQKTQLKWRGLLLLLVLHLHHPLVLVLSFLINQRSPKPRLSELRKITTQRNARMATHQLALLGEAQFTEESQGDPSLISLFSMFFLNGFSFACIIFLFLHQKHRHRWTGRYEAHLWDKSSWNNIQNKKGRQGNFALFFFFFFMKNYSYYINNERTKEICSLFF